MSNVVFVLGGNSNTGKSTAARRLAGELGLKHREVDDIRVTEEARHQAGAKIRQFVDKQDWIDRPEKWPSERLVIAHDLCTNAVMPEVRKAIDRGRPAIFEGDDITPEFAAAAADLGARVAFLIEQDEDVLFAAAVARNRSGRDLDLDLDLLRRYVRGHALYARLLADGAADRNLPVVASRPFDSRRGRLAHALELPPRAR